MSLNIYEEGTNGMFFKLSFNKCTYVFHGQTSQINQYRPILSVIPVFPPIDGYISLPLQQLRCIMVHLLLEIEGHHQRKIKVGGPLPLAVDMGQSNIHLP